MSVSVILYRTLKRLPLVSADLALDGVVSESDQLLVKDPVIDNVGVLENVESVVVEQADEEAEHRAGKTQGVLQLEHIGVLFTSDLHEDEIVRIEAHLKAKEVTVWNLRCASLEPITLLHDNLNHFRFIKVSHDGKCIHVDWFVVVAAVEFGKRVVRATLTDIDETCVYDSADARRSLTL